MPKPKLERVAKVGALPTKEEFYSDGGKRARTQKMKKRRKTRAAAKNKKRRIFGYVVDGTPDPIAGVTVTLSGDAAAVTTTDANGRFAFLVAKGEYTVTPTHASWTFAPLSEANIVISTRDHKTADFVGTAV